MCGSKGGRGYITPKEGMGVRKRKVARINCLCCKGRKRRLCRENTSLGYKGEGANPGGNDTQAPRATRLKDLGQRPSTVSEGISPWCKKGGENPRG